ncbi:hypothetical protein [Sediminispirochaeta bajacaliforniensis]|uniref:hypothetical protein n=1 Tax=Sediminispirochaeta bajacaliforniensis TaxID=148 RepID=UPI0003804DF4|nr:hypothetical protein [Sediminispirochaeta bajacaliforniensis]
MEHRLLTNIISVREFEKALRKGFFGQLIDLFRFGTSHLIPMDPVTSMLGFSSQRAIGRMMVPVKKIIGSEGRAYQFSRRFRPKSTSLKSRWIRIHQAMEEYRPLPPVQLYEIGGYYFVRDGNHRVSVAVAEGIPSVEAEVYSVDFPGSLEGANNLKEIEERIRVVQQKSFSKETGFSTQNNDIFETTFLLGYEKLYRAIAESGLSAERWYEELFLPAIRLMREKDICKAFPGRTCADIFLLFHGFLREADDKDLAKRVFIETARRQRRKPRFSLFMPGK